MERQRNHAATSAPDRESKEVIAEMLITVSIVAMTMTDGIENRPVKDGHAGSEVPPIETAIGGFLDDSWIKPMAATPQAMIALVSGDAALRGATCVALATTDADRA